MTLAKEKKILQSQTSKMSKLMFQNICELAHHICYLRSEHSGAITSEEETHN